MARDRAARPEATPQRLFVAFDLPEDVRTDLAHAVEPLRGGLRGRWTPPANWHVTLKFLGRTWPRLVEWVTEACRSVAGQHASFESALTTLGAFPNERRARVLWAGLDDSGGRASAIAAGLEDALAREFTPEKRAFTPHLTVARFDPALAVGEVLAGIEVASRPFPVDRIALYRSHLQRPAPRYERLQEFPLAGD
jgi:RNA 2',3'-cyclic 3'-phosphodiesterase